MGESIVVNVLRRGERRTHDLLRCPHCDEESCSRMRCMLRVTQLIGSSAEQAHDGGWGSHSSQLVERGDTLVDSLGQCCGVVVPGEVLADVPMCKNMVLLCSSPQQSPLSSARSKRDCCLSTTWPGGSLRTSTPHSRVIRKLVEEVVSLHQCAVVGQQGEEERSQHTPLGSPLVYGDGARCLAADPYYLCSPRQEIQQAVALRVIIPKRI